MAHQELTVAGLRITPRNMPGSAITRVSIDGKDAFGFDPETAAWVQFMDGQQVQTDCDHLTRRAGTAASGPQET